MVAPLSGDDGDDERCRTTLLDGLNLPFPHPFLVGEQCRRSVNIPNREPCKCSKTRDTRTASTKSHEEDSQTTKKPRACQWFCFFLLFSFLLLLPSIFLLLGNYGQTVTGPLDRASQNGLFSRTFLENFCRLWPRTAVTPGRTPFE